MLYVSGPSIALSLKGTQDHKQGRMILQQEISGPTNTPQNKDPVLCKSSIAQRIHYKKIYKSQREPNCLPRRFLVVVTGTQMARLQLSL